MSEVPFHLISTSKMEDTGMVTDFEHGAVKFKGKRFEN
jgi:hypothetical protein